jgi:hypothetical protein
LGVVVFSLSVVVCNELSSRLDVVGGWWSAVVLGWPKRKITGRANLTETESYNQNFDSVDETSTTTEVQAGRLVEQ